MKVRLSPPAISQPPPIDNSGWVRSPTKGHLPGTGMTRGALYTLDKLGLIKSVSVPVAGRKRGIRLFWYPSILAYIDQCAANGGKP